MNLRDSTWAFQNKSVNKHRAVSTMRDTTTYDALTSQSPPSSTIPASEAPQDESYNNRTLKQEDGILQYLPVDILKSVHRTLQSQPVSFEGKIHFLETFEKTLMSEIGESFSFNIEGGREWSVVQFFFWRKLVGNYPL